MDSITIFYVHADHAHDGKVATLDVIETTRTIETIPYGSELNALLRTTAEKVVATR